MLENGLKLKKANLRGVESDGMMMSEQELGYEEKSPGIVVLPDEWIVGAPLQDYLPVSEAVLELELTSNRPDCFSIYGIAREVAAAARLELAPPPTAGPAVLGGAPAAEAIAVEVADPDLCPRYAAQRHPRRHGRRVAGVAQGAPHARRHAAHQQRRRRDQLRHARLGPAAARLRRRQDPRRQAHRPARRGRREDRHPRRRRAHARRPDAGHRRRRAAAGHRRRVRQRRRRGRREHHRPRARGGQLQRPQHPAHRAAHRHPQRGQQPLREGPRREPRARRARLRVAAVRRALRRHRRAGHRRRAGEAPARPRLAYRPAKADALLGYAVPAAEQAGILRRLECEVDERRERSAQAHRRPRMDGHAADVPPRPRARGRPHRGGRAHRRLRPGAGDAAAAHARPAGSPSRSRCGAPCGAPWPAAASTRSSPTRSWRPTRSRRSGCPRATSASTRCASATR